jgi:hypothetical protein
MTPELKVEPAIINQHKRWSCGERGRPARLLNPGFSPRETPLLKRINRSDIPFAGRFADWPAIAANCNKIIATKQGAL